MKKPNPFAPLFRKGGPVSLAPGGSVAKAAAKAVKKALSADERKANLEKLLEPSVIKTPMYHGTSHDIVEFKTPKQQKNKSLEFSGTDQAVFFSPDPQFAERYPGFYLVNDKFMPYRDASAIYPVHVQVKNPFDYDNPEHVDALIDRLWQNLPENPSGMQREKVQRETERLKKVLPNNPNNWSYLEAPEVQKAIQDLGHDAFYVKEMNVKNLGVYDPSVVKSVYGNEGTYDITNPDITKADGGPVKLSGGGAKKIAGAIAKGAKKALTPSQEAFELARIRAALPIEKGGLGLPANNTAADRAAAMGFTKDTYHGSLYNIPKFEIRKASTESHAGKGVYSTSSPEDASLNYASVYGPDPKAKIERSAESRDRYPKFSLAALEEEGLTPRRQEVLASNAINAENLGVVYPLKVRADQSVHIDKPEADVLKVGPFERFDEATERYVDTEGTPAFTKALDEFDALGGEPNDIYDFVQNYGDEFGRVSASDLFNAVKKSAQSTPLIDPNTDDYVSGGVAAANFLKHFGVDEIRHTPSFNNQQLNIAKEHTISLNPENVRSRFAAFDPFRKSSAIAAALGVAAPDLLAEELEKKVPEQKAQGGLIRMQAGGDPRGEMKASPQNPVLGALARGLRSAQNVVGQYQVDPRIPLVGGMGVDELLGIPGAAGLVEDVSYYGPKAAIKGGNVATGGIGTFTLDPRVVDVAGVAELGGLGVQAAKGAGKAVGQQLQRQLTASPLESQLGMARVNQVQAPVSKLGFYSPVEQAALNIQRKQGPGQAFLNEIQRAENVNKEFLQSSGIAQKLAVMPKVTREEVQEMVKGSVPEVQQVMLGETVVPPYAKEWLKVHMPEFDPSDVTQIDEAIALANQRYDKLVNEGELGLAEFAADAIDDLENMKRQYKPGTKAAEALSKYGQYTVPGGENYREMLLTLPTSQPIDRDGLAQSLYGRSFDDLDVNQAARVMNELSSPTDGKTYRSTHWSQPNVLSHVRMNDRTDAEGKKVLFIEELQSDWGQEGRKKGFADSSADAKYRDYLTSLKNRASELIMKNFTDEGVPPDRASQLTSQMIGRMEDWNFAKLLGETSKLDELFKAKRAAEEGVPSAPFVQNTKDWVDLSLKNILKRAVDEGYDRVAFINGKQSADRFRLQNVVSSIEWNPPGDRLQQKGADGFVTIYLRNGNPVELPLTREGKVLEGIGTQFDGKGLDEIVGKEVAQKIIASPSGSLAGEGLSIGGTGMKKFYDEIVPERIRKVIGKESSLRDIQFEDKTAKLREELANATPGSSRYLYLTDKIGEIERDAERYGALGNQIGFDITPELREKFSAPIPYKDGGAVKLAAGGGKKIAQRAAMAVKEFVDPKTTKIEDWQWKPLAEVDKQLKLTEVPDYIQRGYGDFMIEQAKRAGSGQMGVRDLIKAFGITQSSIGRGGLSHATATKAGLKVPKTEGLVRPEGAFAEWLGSKMGQKFLDDAERGVVNQKALDDIRVKFAPFGKPNQLTEQLAYAVNNLPNVMPQMQQALTGPVDQYRDWAESMKGIAGAKSGFIGSLLGRGDLPTLDARQLNLHALEAPVGTGSIMARGKGLGAREAVDRLAARQSALGLDIDPTLDPHYQHLAHHAVWDKVADEKTTHDDLMRALRGYKAGGQPDIDAMRLEMQRKSWRSK